MKKIQKEHIALIIKYTGISFITGGISHGFFSGERQILTSLVGIVFFIIGTILEQKPDERDYKRTIIFSAILAVAIGALTGGLQHFPDSPDRSLWIVPLGFLISVYAFVSLEKELYFTRSYLNYTLAGFIFFIVVSLCFYWIVSEGYFVGSHNHYDGHHDIVSENEEILLPNDEVLESIEIEEVHFEGDGHTDHNH